jgi:hypothetical protein
MLGTQYDLIGRRDKQDFASREMRFKFNFKEDFCLPTAFGCHWMERNFGASPFYAAPQTKQSA